MTLMLLEIHAIAISIAKVMHAKRSLSGRMSWPLMFTTVSTSPTHLMLRFLVCLVGKHAQFINAYQR